MLIIESSKEMSNTYPQLKSPKHDDLLHIRPAHQEYAAAFTDLANELLQTYSSRAQLIKRIKMAGRCQRYQTQATNSDHITPYYRDEKSKKLIGNPSSDSLIAGFFASSHLCKKIFPHLEKFGIEGHPSPVTDSKITLFVEQTEDGMLHIKPSENKEMSAFKLLVMEHLLPMYGKKSQQPNAQGLFSRRLDHIMPYLINKYTGMLDTAPGSENSPMTIIPGFYLSQDLFEVMRPVLLNHAASIQDKRDDFAPSWNHLINRYSS